MYSINEHNNVENSLKGMVTDVTSMMPANSGNLYNVYFDNGGTTPPFKSVVSEMEEYTPWYKYVSHNSLKADFLSALYEQGRKTIKHFVNADMKKDTAIYTKNTTEAINTLANVMYQQPTAVRPVIITTYMEHLSDYLPWIFRFDTVLVDVKPDGRLSMLDFERKLYEYQDRVRLVAVTGASNVTGFINPIYQIARLAHHYGAEILVDAAQLIQHRTINMNPNDQSAHIDYLAFSAHKIYAPFFTGVLVGNKDVLNQGYPLCFGAGMTELVTDEKIVLKDSPQRYEAGSNNIMGAIALSSALLTIDDIGMDVIKKHEKELLTYGINKLEENPNIILYGDTNNLEHRIPIIAFNVKGKSHEETAKYLYDNHGIIAKNGLCGADLYVEKLTQGSPCTGVVRISMAMYNRKSEVDRLAEALKQFVG